jgi:chemotaxis protein MotB
MSRRKKQTAHANHERWLVSYADFITLLFAFFVVLYASSQIDNKKVAQLAAAIQGGFQQMGVFSGTAPGPILRDEHAPPSSTAPAELSGPQLVRVINDLNAKARGGESHGASGVPPSEIRKELEDVLGKELKEHQVDLRMVPGGLVVSLREVGFFNSGEAMLLPQAEPTLAHVASALNARNFEVRVEGHTDDVPIHNSIYRSNWDLSTARATEVVNMLVSKYGFNPERISIAGYAQYRPIASNDTEEGRRKNRRIDLVIVSSPSEEQ